MSNSLRPLRYGVLYVAASVAISFLSVLHKFCNNMAALRQCK